jgi:hypothetical protein
VKRTAAPSASFLFAGDGTHLRRYKVGDGAAGHAGVTMIIEGKNIRREDIGGGAASRRRKSFSACGARGQRQCHPISIWA